MTNILIAVPCLDMVAADFAFSLTRLVLHGGAPATVVDIRSNDVAWSRNEAVHRALTGGYTHLFFLDSDMSFPADALTRLLAHGKPIVGASYIKRCEPYNLLGAWERSVPASGLCEALELPTGCMLINTAVFAKLSYPWFYWEYGEKPGERNSEDLVFCRNARKAGVRIWADMSLTTELGHVGVKAYTVRDGIEYVARKRYEAQQEGDTFGVMK